MRELESSLQQFGEFLLKAQLGTAGDGSLLRALGPTVPDAAGVR